MRQVPMLLVATLLVALSGCGGDDASNEDAGSLPYSYESLGSAAEKAKGYWTELADVKLTDQMMEEFFTLAEALKEASGDRAKQVALVADHGWSWQQWSAVATQLSAMALGEAVPAIDAELARIDKEIERVRGEIATASGEEKQMLEARLQQMEQVREIQEKQLRPMMESAEKALDNNRAILEKYRERWEELGFDE